MNRLSWSVAPRVPLEQRARTPRLRRKRWRRTRRRIASIPPISTRGSRCSTRRGSTGASSSSGFKGVAGEIRGHAERLIEHVPSRREEGLRLLREVAARVPDERAWVEQQETINEARRLLAAEEGKTP